MRTTSSHVVHNLQGAYWEMGSVRKEYVDAHTRSSVRHLVSCARVCEGAPPGPMTIAALDARGCIVALKMEDGSGLMRPDIAVGKAWGALGLGFGTRHLAGRAQSLPQFFGALADLADGRVLPVPGGVLVRDQERRVIGAVGASGDVADNDEAMVLAGIASVSGLLADPGQALA